MPEIEEQIKQIIVDKLGVDENEDMEKLRTVGSLIEYTTAKSNHKVSF